MAASKSPDPTAIAQTGLRLHRDTLELDYWSQMQDATESLLELMEGAREDSLPFTEDSPSFARWLALQEAIQALEPGIQRWALLADDRCSAALQALEEAVRGVPARPYYRQHRVAGRQKDVAPGQDLPDDGALLFAEDADMMTDDRDD